MRASGYYVWHLPGERRKSDPRSITVINAPLPKNIHGWVSLAELDFACRDASDSPVARSRNAKLCESRTETDIINHN